ncbi:DUF3413 domain-containing protein [Photobacterium sanguinicancri]|uniref:DUF3413 domain-containing protein n=1 Tax=Photobacterium sanguinicancri TaxID=875932 RepID=A0AAW7Y2G3_9GAMM|nr:DUF3413 domain-containing protein [Photobacterium sanguinicancri]MDO6542589.1 DUF3413 domain-containing protein [Photobacterium sanguinicancri]
MVASGNNYKDKVSQLISWGHWFSFFNIIAAMLLGTRYIVHSEWPVTLLGQLYLLLSWVGHFGFLVFGLYILIIFPASFLIPSQRLMRLFAVLIATLGLTTLILDTYAYTTLDLHLSPLVWDLLLSGEKSELNARWQYLFIAVPILFLLQLVLSEWLWRKLRKITRKHVGGPIALVFGLCFLGSHLVYIWADAFLYRPVTMQRSNFPLSYPMTAKTFMEKHGLIDRNEYAKRKEEAGENHSPLIRYPIEKLSFSDQGTNQNVLIVMIDGLRSDMVSSKIMPNLASFADQNINYKNHYSTSNDNTVGIFGLFYGLPGSYLESVRAESTSPVLVSTLNKRKYQFGLFSGDHFSSPIYYQTIFEQQKLANHSSDNATPSDQLAVDNWQTWLTTTLEDDKPWFSYIELLAVQEFEEDGGYTPTFTPSLSTTAKNTKISDPGLLLKNSYRNAANYADSLVGQILAALEAQQVLDNTIIIFTSNHGTEFNETGTNSWGSNSNYSQYQLKVPLVIHWPNRDSDVIETVTSHLDVAPTLMEALLNVSTTSDKYSSGNSLFDNENTRRWVIAGDSKDIVVIQKNTTTVVDRYGNYQVYDEHYKIKDERRPKLSTLMQVMNELKRFYHPQK